MKTNTLTPELLHKMNAYWRAANYLSVGRPDIPFSARLRLAGGVSPWRSRLRRRKMSVGTGADRAESDLSNTLSAGRQGAKTKLKNERTTIMLNKELKH